jgi:hypothetical protein
MNADEHRSLCRGAPNARLLGSRAPSSLIEQESPNLRTGSKVEEQTQLKISGAQIIQYLGFVYRLQSGARLASNNTTRPIMRSARNVPTTLPRKNTLRGVSLSTKNPA